MRNPLDPFSKVVDDQSHWDPEWYSWLTDLSDNVTKLQASIVAQQANNAAQQAAITALQNPPPGVSPGLVFLSSQVASNSSQIIFTGINNTYDAYQFHITALRPSVHNVQLIMQMSLNGGATWRNTSNMWSWVYAYMGVGDPLEHSSAIDTMAYFRLGGATSSSWGNLSEVILYPNSSQCLNSITWRSLDYYDAGGGVYHVIGSGIEVADATPCNAVRFLFNSGNIVSGRISMYGLRKI